MCTIIIRCLTLRVEEHGDRHQNKKKMRTNYHFSNGDGDTTSPTYICHWSDTFLAPNKNKKDSTYFPTYYPPNLFNFCNNRFVILHYFFQWKKNRGKFAQVRRISHKKSGTLYAAKTIKRRRPRYGDATDEIMHEIRVLMTADPCQFIVGLHEVFETRTEFVLVLEL